MTEGALKITIDPALCTGRARCYNLYTDLFEEGPDAKGVLKVTGELDNEDLEVDAQLAANACPQGAIIIED